MKNRNAIIFAICLLLNIGGCSFVKTGPVENDIGKSNAVIVPQPRGYRDPLAEMERIHTELDKYRSVLDAPISIGNKAQERYFSYVEAVDQSMDDQQNIEDQLIKNGELELVPGQSYHFSLESFCVFGKSPRPVKGDGFRISEINGPAKNYLPFILENYSQKEIPQYEMQRLIWGLLSGLKFDQLSDRDKSILKLFYPDAEARFGNQAIIDVATRVFDEFIPDSIKSQVDYVRDLKSDFLKYQDNFQELESIMAPIESRSPIPLGWIKTEAGYYIKLTNEGSYTNISVEIYVPDDFAVKEDRSPQSLKQLVFAPWKYVALPGSGQRLAMSSKVIKYKGKKEEDLCAEIRSWKSKKCRELTVNDREKIIKISAPANFPRTRYVSPPDSTKPIEVETDCSHFTNEIYHRIGIDFPYVPTSLVRCLKYFKEVSTNEAKPGDLILYKGHIAIYTGNSHAVSATKTRGFATKSVNNEKFQSSIKIYPMDIFGKGRFIKWSCN